MTFRYGLDKGSKKFMCPGCGRKTFVKAYDYEEKSYIADHVGKCDRDNKCGYSFTYAQFFKEEGVKYEPKTERVERKVLSFVPYEKLRDVSGKENHFANWLLTLFTESEVKIACAKYMIGGGDYKDWEKSTYYWQVDLKGKVRAGKIMQYNPETGKRVKKPYNRIQWVHKIMERSGEVKEFGLNQCLFGLHLLNHCPKTAEICVVESEKTAVLMSIFEPGRVWLATGGLQNMGKSMLDILRGRNVVFYPDFGCLDIWTKKIEKLNLKYKVSKIIDKIGKEGDDIADIFLRNIQ